jgi:hypothetical protein
MINWDMAKRSGSPASIPSAPKRRGRPPKPGGKLSQVEIQRAYRARLVAAGKVVRIVDAVTLSPAQSNPALAAMSDFDPARDGVYDREMVAGLRDQLHNALLKAERLEGDIARLTARNVDLEGELILQHQHHTNSLKANIVLKKQLAEMTQRPAKRRRV